MQQVSFLLPHWLPCDWLPWPLTPPPFKFLGCRKSKPCDDYLDWYDNCSARPLTSFLGIESHLGEEKETFFCLLRGQMFHLGKVGNIITTALNQNEQRSYWTVNQYQCDSTISWPAAGVSECLFSAIILSEYLLDSFLLLFHRVSSGHS